MNGPFDLDCWEKCCGFSFGAFFVCFILDNKGTSVIHAEMYANLNARLHGIFYGVQMIHLLHLFWLLDLKMLQPYCYCLVKAYIRSIRFG